MPNTAAIIREAESLPVEERALVVDALLSLTGKWAAVAERRLDDLRAGRVVAVAGEEVFAKIRRRLE